MIYKILKEYIRRIIRNYKIYAVSIIGMSIAIIATFHIYHFAFNELNVDGFHAKKKEIYRVVNKNEGSNYRSVATPIPLGEFIKEKFPETEEYTSIIPSMGNSYMINKVNETGKALYVDPSFFELFSFPLKSGSISKFRNSINTVIISEKMALKTFGTEDVLGKMITMSDKFNTEEQELEIVGILENITNLSTIQGDVFINIKSNKNAKLSKGKKKWSQQFADTFIHVPGSIKTIENLSKRITGLVRLEIMPSDPDNAKKFINYSLQRLDAMYFHSSDINSQKRKGSLQFVNILLLVGILTLLLAVLNYVLMNLGLGLTTSLLALLFIKTYDASINAMGNAYASLIFVCAIGNNMITGLSWEAPYLPLVMFLPVWVFLICDIKSGLLWSCATASVFWIKTIFRRVSF